MDLILHNGRIHTIDEENPKVSAIAIKDGRIFAIGKDEDILKLANENTKIIDLEAKTIVPGFNDSHLHNVKYGIFTGCCDLSECTSLNELIARTKNFIKTHKIKPGSWVVGRGWNHDKFDNKMIPTREELDTISKEHPIVLFRCCSHMLIVNTKALEVLNIDKTTPQIEGGFFDVEKGIFREKAKELVQVSLKGYDVHELKKFIKISCRDLLAQGITSIQTDDFNMSEDFHRIVKAYSELTEEGELGVRVNQQCLITNMQEFENIVNSGIQNLNINDFYKIGPIKIISDGSLGARSAAMRKPYADDGNTKGILIFEEEELYELIEAAHCKGFYVAVHCIGDQAAENAINCYEKVMKKYPDKSLRHGIVHCQITDNEQIDRIRKADLLVYAQPIFLDYDLHIVGDRVGKKLASTSYKFGDMVKKGVHLSMGTDAPVELFNPMQNIYCAVTRKDKNGQPLNGFYPDQCMTVEESIKAYTSESAYCSYEENVKGKIKVGYFADLAVLSDNIFEIEPAKLLDVKVEMTLVNGEIRYTAKEIL